MDLSEKQLARFASLAGLPVEDSEHASIVAQLQKVLSYMEMLSRVDIQGIAPMETYSQGGVRLRDDDVDSNPSRTDCFSESCRRDKGYVVVSRVLETAP